MSSDFNFKLIKTHNKARLGLLQTAHGVIRTPAFMPVGTQGTVKAMPPEFVENTKADIILGNTYHLMLRPTAERIANLGGLHKFMNWKKPILTDSGGFQVMSLSSLTKISETGVEFKSHLDGSKHLLTPERSTEIQYLLGSDITMVLDQCIAYPATYEEASKAMNLSLKWAERSRKAFTPRQGYGQFGIVQGSNFEQLRYESSKNLVDIGFEGYAIGGLAVGEGQKIMFEVLDYSVDFLPTEKPRYLMGVGKPSDIIGAVKRGVDMFDCVIPTRSGRNGQAFTKQGSINIKNAIFKDDPTALESDCPCITCSSYSKAYLHHLFKAGEILGAILLTTHNLTYYQDLMQRLRDYINDAREIDFSA